MLKITIKSYLKETPLADIIEYNPENKPATNFSSIGFTNNDQNFKAKAKLLWKNSEHNWFLVVLQDVEQIHTNNFQTWLAQQNFPSNSKILVIESISFPNDFKSPAWLTGHDIIGHGIGKKTNVNDDLYRLSRKAQREHSVYLPNNLTLRAIWNTLPRNFRLSTGGSTGFDDMLPDILFAAFAKKLDKKKAVAAVLEEAGKNVQDIAEQYVQIIFDSVQKFIEMIPNNKPQLIFPF